MQAIKNNAMQAMVNTSLAMASKPADVLDVDLVLAQSDLAVIGDAVDAFIVAEGELLKGDEGMRSVAVAVSKVLGAKPSYEWWELVSTTWQKVYMTRNNLSNEKSSQNAWYVVAKRMAREFELVKPAKGSKDSARMSEKRAKEKAEMEKLTDSVLLELIAESKAKDDFKSAGKFKAEIERRAKEKDKGVADKVKAEREEVVKLLKACTDIATIRKVKALLSK